MFFTACCRRKASIRLWPRAGSALPGLGALTGVCAATEISPGVDYTVYNLPTPNSVCVVAADHFPSEYNSKSAGPITHRIVNNWTHPLVLPIPLFYPESKNTPSGDIKKVVFSAIRFFTGNVSGACPECGTPVGGGRKHVGNIPTQ